MGGRKKIGTFFFCLEKRFFLERGGGKVGPPPPPGRRGGGGKGAGGRGGPWTNIERELREGEALVFAGDALARLCWNYFPASVDI